ncbi:fumarate reductase subunit FrdD [Halomonas garicola]|uniref:fumarate reductase subunit FrdD n=1 Tax=Halomonas garicola TaxID=1690008 RepID=UPI0028A1DB8E|nr:fumarate reductase subunit FrdD [Halomonas garicola]
MEHRIKKSAEPVWWALFSAGGVCFAVFVPAAILFIALLFPLGVLPTETFDFERSRAMLFSFFGLMFVGAVICLPLYHAMHRIRHGLHDLKLGSDKTNKTIAYSIATLFSLLALLLVLLGILSSNI